MAFTYFTDLEGVCQRVMQYYGAGHHTNAPKPQLQCNLGREGVDDGEEGVFSYLEIQSGVSNDVIIRASCYLDKRQTFING